MKQKNCGVFLKIVRGKVVLITALLTVVPIFPTGIVINSFIKKIPKTTFEPWSSRS